MKSEVEVSIIIVNYNTSNLINDCLASIDKFVSDLSYEVIIVDNASENLSETIKVNNKEKVLFIQLPQNIGFGSANNAGVKIARGRYLFFLNPDTLLLNNAVKLIHDFLENYPWCGACGGNLYDERGFPIHSYRRVLPGVIDSLDILSNHFISKLIWGKSYENNNTSSPLNVGYITGADLMIPTKVFKDVGGFDKQFFLYYEETDLCCRIKKMGYKVCSLPKAKIVHLVGRSHNEEKEYRPNEFVYNCEGYSRNLYYKKHLSSTQARLSKVILYINYKLRLLYFNLKKNKSQQSILKLRIKYL